MGTVTRFPQERVDYSRLDGLVPIGTNRGATILVMPVVRIERDDDHLLCEDAFSAVKASFDELHEALKAPPI
jgi:hypothetical protein